MKLQLQMSISNVTAEEDPILVEIEELPQQRCNAMGSCSQHPCQAHLSPTSGPDLLLYPRSTYIKSFSHDSSSSKQTSLDTSTTVDYISAHEPGQEYQEEEDDEDFPEMIGFFPSHDFLTEPLQFGGKLTLDTVKVNCGEIFLNNF